VRYLSPPPLATLVCRKPNVEVGSRKPLNRIAANVEQDPPAAVGSCKEMIESVCKFILLDYGVEFSEGEAPVAMWAREWAFESSGPFEPSCGVGLSRFPGSSFGWFDLGAMGCESARRRTPFRQKSRPPDSNRGPLHYEPWDRDGVCRLASVERSD